MSYIYVHCGFHKTGSTALQIALSQHSGRLQAEGFLYPRSGLVGDEFGQGHHNIAWQLCGDRRFDRQQGDLESLFNEIKHFDGKVILSSEDFEGVVGHPERLVQLVERGRAIGREVVLVIYLRNQIEYVESLFQEMVRHGFGDQYLHFADSALSSGRLKIQEWEFLFDYPALADILSVAPQTKTIFRSYHSMVQNSPILDFSSVIGLDLRVFEEVAANRFNSRENFESSLLSFYRNRVGRDVSRNEQTITKLLAAGAITKPRTTGRLRHALRIHFNYLNRDMCKRFGLSEFGLVSLDDDIKTETLQISMQRAFSFGTQFIIGDLSFALNKQHEILSKEVKAEIERWFIWVSES